MSLQDSLCKLRMDYVYILHVYWWDYTTATEEIMDSLHALILSRKVLYLGINNTHAWVIATASTYSRLQGCIPFTIYQGRWNVLHRDLEILPMA